MITALEVKIPAHFNSQSDHMRLNTCIRRWKGYFWQTKSTKPPLPTFVIT